MKHHFTSALASTETLTEAQQLVLATLQRVKADRHKHLGYVAGIISSDGHEHIDRNIQRLAAYTEQLRRQYPFPVFSATDVFTPDLFVRLEEMNLDRAEREERFVDFWHAILSSGHVTHVFFTPRWEQSAGASDEHETAKRLGLTISYVEDTATR